MPNPLNDTRLQGIMVAVFIIDWMYHASLQARLKDGVDHWQDVASLVRSHMNDLQPFESTIEQTTETMPASHKTITAAAITTNRITSLRELLHLPNMPPVDSKTVPAARSDLTMPSLWLAQWPPTHARDMDFAGCHVNTDHSNKLQ